MAQLVALWQTVVSLSSGLAFTDLERARDRRTMNAPKTLLANFAASRENNFDLIRLIAAMSVLVFHCYRLTGTAVPASPRLIADFFGAVVEQGVPVFFAISGFLIARSWVSNPRVLTYASKRLLRLIPALVVCVGLISFVLGPALTTLELGAYLSNQTPYLYVLRSAVLFTFHGILPGVFTDNPYPDAVNGSLWTLPVEASAYFAIGALGLVGLMTRRWGLASVFAAALLLASPLVSLAAFAPVAAENGAATGTPNLVISLLAVFFAGSLLFVYRRHVILNWWLAAVLAGLWLLTWDSAWAGVIAPLTIPYLVLITAYRTPRALSRLTRPGDVSYGVYIYAFPIQQSIAAIWTGVDPVAMFVVAAPLAYLAGLASWRLIEKPALALKRRLPPATVGLTSRLPE